MTSSNKFGYLRFKVNRFFKALWGGIVSACFFLVIILLWSANISSCLTSGDSTRERDAAKLKITEVDAGNSRHVRIQHALESIWSSATGKDNPKIFIVDSREINAASFGSGRFLVWDGVADLPDSIIDAIFAHELGHDIRRHAKKAQDVKDLTDFFGDVLSVFGRTDAATENTLKRWVGYTALPKYSRTQEFEADGKAVEILREIGYAEPQKRLSEALQVLLDKYGNIGGGFFDSHPSTTERIQRLRSEAEDTTRK